MEPSFSLMLFGVNAIYVVLVVIAMVALVLSMRQAGQSSIGVLLGHFLTVIILLAVIRGLFFVYDIGLLNVDEATMMVMWHLIFYNAILVFLFVVHAFVGISNTGKQKPSRATAWVVGVSSLVVSAMIIGLAAPINMWVVSSFKDTLWDSSGLLHGIAFVFAGLVASYLFRIKKKYERMIGSFAQPLLYAVGMLSAIHAWELVNESWRIISLAEGVGESVEQFLWIPVYGAVAIAFWQLQRLLTK